MLIHISVYLLSLVIPLCSRVLRDEKVSLGAGNFLSEN